VFFDTNMKVRFLLSGLAFFGVAFVLAALPVLAEGGTAPPCTITGANGGDLLIGTAGADVICGYGGSDIITAKGGNDIVRGGGGPDQIYGDGGSDHLYGGAGNDKLYARDAVKDWVYGGRGSDYARDDDPEDVLRSIESH
jgi:Ca2+-binding RTX toxin-like protein